MKHRLWLTSAVLVCGSASAQAAAITAPRSDVPLVLQVVPEGFEKGFPVSFTFYLVNRSDHDLRVPLPTIECEDTDSGSIWLRMHLVPLKQATGGLHRGCVTDSDQPSSILERAREWPVLRPGESLTLRDKLGDLHLEPLEPGRYDLWAQYVPPFVSPKDKQKLVSAGVDVADASTPSNHLVYVKLP